MVLLIPQMFLSVTYSISTPHWLRSSTLLCMMLCCVIHLTGYVIACHVLIQTLSCHQVHIGTVLTVDIGILRYTGAANVVFGATVSAIIVVTVVIATIVCLVIVGCKQYKKRLYHAKAQNEQLEQEVINMESQVTMIHEQMKGTHWAHTNHACIHTLPALNCMDMNEAS